MTAVVFWLGVVILLNAWLSDATRIREQKFSGAAETPQDELDLVPKETSSYPLRPLVDMLVAPMTKEAFQISTAGHRVVRRRTSSLDRKLQPRMGLDWGLQSGKPPEEVRQRLRKLTPDFLWTMNLQIAPLDLPDDSTCEPANINVKLRFKEEPRNEPPGGKMLLESCTYAGKDEPVIRLGEYRWELGENAGEFKDGIWIWGFWDEPLYPYMLFTLDLVKELQCDGYIIPAGPLVCQIGHRRRDGGVLLGRGKVDQNVNTRMADFIDLRDYGFDQDGVDVKVQCGIITAMDTYAITPKAIIRVPWKEEP